jgi:hypothetical protein
MRRRRYDFRQATRAPLVILAGLPNPICVAVAAAIETRSRTRVIYQPSCNDGRHLYTEKTVRALVNAVSGFAVRHLKSEEIPLIPEHILLAYVPADDQERLLAEFEFYVFPVPLSLLAEYDENGRQNRHNRTLAEKYIVSSLETALREFTEIKSRLSSVSDKEPLFLPPQNFRVSGTEPIAYVFRSMMRQRTSWADLIDSVQRVAVTSDDLCKHIRKGIKKTVLSDARDLLFPHDPSEHGPERELPQDCSDNDRKHLMRTSFRFGVRLRNGFHHDVQFAGRNLNGQTFECTREGLLQLNCSHANIYPNDYVRPAET